MTDDLHSPIKCPICGKMLAFIEYATKIGKNGKIAKWPVYEKCDKKLHSEAAKLNQHIALKKQEEQQEHKSILKPTAAIEQVLNTDYAKAELKVAAIPKTEGSLFSPPSLEVQDDYRLPYGASGMLYQTPKAKGDDERITIKVLETLLQKYRQRFEVSPKSILISPKDNAVHLSLEAPDDFPPIGTSQTLTPGFGYVFLEHPAEIVEQIHPTRKEINNG